jgi:hypothetical protein
MKNWRRYEILLPLRFNDGNPVPKGDVEDTPEVRAFFAQFKERIKARFQQLDIWSPTMRSKLFGRKLCADAGDADDPGPPSICIDS